MRFQSEAHLGAAMAALARNEGHRPRLPMPDQSGHRPEIVAQLLKDMQDFSEWSVADAARAMGVPNPTAQDRIYKAIKAGAVTAKGGKMNRRYSQVKPMKRLSK